jgi:hypothetical protein
LITYTQFQTDIARDLRDPSNTTFDPTTIDDLFQAALVEVGRIAPNRFQEDITPIADTITYTLQSAIWSPSDVVPEIEVVRVEVWDGSQTPDAFVFRVQPASAEYLNQSDVGWHVWGRTLYIPNNVESMVDPAVHYYRVWGYAPYGPVSVGEYVPVSEEVRWAMRAYCRLEGLQRLSMDRDLFTQWQTRAGNTDVSPAALMNAVSMAQEDWRRRERKLLVLRQAP